MRLSPAVPPSASLYSRERDPVPPTTDSLFEFIPLAPLLLGTLPANATATVPVLARPRDTPWAPARSPLSPPPGPTSATRPRLPPPHVAVGSGRIGSVCSTPSQVASGRLPRPTTGRGWWRGLRPASAGSTFFTLQVWVPVLHSTGVERRHHKHCSCVAQHRRRKHRRRKHRRRKHRRRSTEEESTEEESTEEERSTAAASTQGAGQHTVFPAPSGTVAHSSADVLAQGHTDSETR